MAVLTFNTANQSWRQLFGNGTIYRVPQFQRDYSWTQDQWDDLWQDIEALMQPGSETAHYMGYLVLQAKNNKTFEVIDGQQRLTTLSILALVVIKCLDDLAASGAESESNKMRTEQLRNIYIGFLDPVSLVSRSKLTLNRNNNSFYQDVLIPLRPSRRHGLRASENQLRKAFDWLLRKVRERFPPETNGAAIAGFLDKLSDQLFFTVVTVTDELNAFRVFETLNARGVRLSPTDLLKNYLFSVVAGEGTHQSDMEALERRWQDMVDQLADESFPDFLRTHWNSRESLVRESELFKVIREKTRNREAVFKLIEQMREDVATYAALADPNQPLWDHQQKPYVQEMKMFGVRQTWPMLLAAYRQLVGAQADPAAFANVLRACSIIALRYNVIGGLATHEQERTYNKVAVAITQRSITNEPDIIRALSPIYISDDQFQAAFSEKSLKTTNTRNAQIAKYILFALEKQLTGSQFDASGAQYNLEHILPQNPTEGWEQFSAAGYDDFAYRLGNFTLLSTSDNRSAANKPFDVKRAIYQASEFQITRRVAEENETWTPERITARQQWMARQASGIWRLSQLDAGRPHGQ